MHQTILCIIYIKCSRVFKDVDEILTQGWSDHFEKWFIAEFTTKVLYEWIFFSVGFHTVYFMLLLIKPRFWFIQRAFLVPSFSNFFKYDREIWRTEWNVWTSANKDLIEDFSNQLSTWFRSTWENMVWIV